MDDREFDRMMEEELGKLSLPDQEVAVITPWRKAVSQIVWGIGLTTLTINHLYLNYLLPMVGMVLLLLGHRTLRQENKWFRMGWYLTVAEAVRMFVVFVQQATLWDVGAVLVWQLGWSVLHMARLCCLWQAVRTVRRQAGQPNRAGAVVALMVWSAVLYIAAFLQGGGWLVVLPILVAYICILTSLAKLPGLLDDAGYVVKAAPIRVTDWIVGVAYVGSLMACVLVALLGFGRYPMNWQPAGENWQGNTAAIRENLAELGFPEDLLEDLPEEELLRCEGATYVDWDEQDNSHSTWEVNGKEPEVLLVAITLPGGRYRLFQAFRWSEDPSVRGMDCIELWPPEDGRSDGDIRWEDIDGQLFCEMEGGTYRSSYCSLEEVMASYDSIFFGWTQQRAIYGAFSFPAFGENCRGYVAYDLELEESYWEDWPEGVTRDRHYAWLNYTYQKSWFNYPMTTGLEYRLSGGLRNHVFDRAQYQLEAYVRLNNEP